MGLTGEEIVPLILQELRERPDMWFWALRVLTGANPVRGEDAGRLALMAESWLEWGRARNLIS